jgi:hypothetical protein
LSSEDEVDLVVVDAVMTYGRALTGPALVLEDLHAAEGLQRIAGYLIVLGDAPLVDAAAR